MHALLYQICLYTQNYVAQIEDYMILRELVLREVGKNVYVAVFLAIMKEVYNDREVLRN